MPPLDFTTLQVAEVGQTDIIVRRDFRHPPALVWRALTEPALIRQWMAVTGYPMTRCEITPHAGGSFHFEWAGADGNSFFFSGPIMVAEPPHHMVHAELFNGDPGMRSEIITDLAPHGTGTRMTMRMHYDSPESRAAAIATGMTDGMEETYARLDALVLPA